MGASSRTTNDDNGTARIASSSSTLIYAADLAVDETLHVALKQLGPKGLAAVAEPASGNSSSSRSNSSSSSSSNSNAAALELLAVTGNADRLSLTLMGYKGGLVEDQINQDRGFVWYNATANCSMIGVLDGHGTTGHFVSEHARDALIGEFGTLLGTNPANEEEATDKSNTHQDAISQAFLRVEASLPQRIAIGGGATVSIVLQQNDTIYVANAGDSQSLIAAAVTVPLLSATPETTITVLYASRLDKPDDPDERARILKAGGIVSEASDDDDARVSYMQDGEEWGLAMSRSVGDIAAVGVTAEPLVHVFSKQALVERARTQWQEDCESFKAAASANDTDDDCSDKTALSLDIQLFVVSATDGLVDYFEPAELARVMGAAFYDPATNTHPLKAAEALIHAATKEWHDEMAGEYRDDITLSAARIL